MTDKQNGRDRQTVSERAGERQTHRHTDRQTETKREKKKEKKIHSLFLGWLLNIPAIC